MNPVGELLVRARRRLRGLWLAATLVWLAPLVAGVALALVLLGRIRPWAWPEPVALGVALLSVAAVIVAAVVQRVPDPVVARAADRGLGTRDAFATALEREGGDGPFDAGVRARAEQLAERADVRRALPVALPARRMVAGGSVAVLALFLGLSANPQDDVRRRQAQEQAQIDQAAAALDEAAAGLTDAVGEGEVPAPALAELQALADALARTSSLEEAQALLDRSEAALRAGLTPDALARKAAVKGLEESLAAEPLPGAPAEADAASQMEAAAATLDELDAAQQAALADRLERLAETLRVGNPDVAAALDQAAAALASGNTRGAQAALGEAASAQRAARAQVAAAEAARAALGAVGEARARLGEGSAGSGSERASGAEPSGRGNGEGNGEGQGEGQGQGQGSGQGQGQGDGSGQGSGQGGSGQGGGQGGGSPSGQVAGASGGSGSGRGGSGTPGGTGQTPSSSEQGTDEPSLYDPTGSGEQLDLGGSATGQQPGQVIGRGQGPSSQGSAFVPLSSAVASFRQRVTAALDDPTLSPSMRQLVRAYFDRLTEGS